VTAEVSGGIGWGLGGPSHLGVLFDERPGFLRKITAMRGLYAIVDTRTLRARAIDVVAFSRAVLAARPAALQLRAKSEPPRELLALLRVLSPLCREAGVPFVVNDRPELAALAGCDYAHLGQDDLPF
jgi:thiamine-phosphate pyrophosphorylase